MNPPALPMLELMNHDNKWFYTTFRYDGQSRLQHTDWFWRPQSIVDSGDNLSPDWNTFSMEYVYDEDSGFLTAVKDGTDHEWWKCALSDYDEQGRVAGFEQGNGVATAERGQSRNLVIRNKGSPIIGSGQIQNSLP